MARTLGYAPLNRWERVVYDRLRADLPVEWLVIANVSWTRRSGSGHQRYVRVAAE